MSKHSCEPDVAEKRTKWTSEPYDFQSEHAAEVLRRSAEQMESLLDAPNAPKDFVSSILEDVRAELQCEYHLLASEQPERQERPPTVIHTNMDGYECGLSSLFTETLTTSDGTSGRDVTSEDEPFISAARQIGLVRSNQKHEKLDLMIVVFAPTTLPDLEFPKAAFLTYDQYVLRTRILEIAVYMRHEHWIRTQAFNEARTLDQHPMQIVAAGNLLEFEAYVGLSPDPEVFAVWLKGENTEFRDDDKGEAHFKEVLKNAEGWIDKVEAEEDKKVLQQILFESHLLQLTKSGERPLLSQRIEEARKLARLS